MMRSSHVTKCRARLLSQDLRGTLDSMGLEPGATDVESRKRLVDGWQRRCGFAIPKVESSTTKPTASVIFLHGLGDNGLGWSPVFRPFIHHIPHIRFVCPSALPRQCLGMHTTAWFGLTGKCSRLDEDADGIEHSAAFVHSVIEREIAIVGSASRVVVGGFSQGGALALFASHTFPEKLAGIVSCSAYIPAQRKLTPRLSSANCPTPLEMHHGMMDEVVPHGIGMESTQRVATIRREGTKTTAVPDPVFHSYADMGHEACNDQLARMCGFFNRVVPPTVD